MLKKDVKIGGQYVAKVSSKLTVVRINWLNKATSYSRESWEATNIKTGKSVHIRSAAKLRSEVKS